MLKRYKLSLAMNHGKWAVRPKRFIPMTLNALTSKSRCGHEGFLHERPSCLFAWRVLPWPYLARAVGNHHFCDTTKRASQRLTPHRKGEIPKSITEVLGKTRVINHNPVFGETGQPLAVNSPNVLRSLPFRSLQEPNGNGKPEVQQI